MVEKIKLKKEEKKDLIYQWAFKKAIFYPTAEIYRNLAGFYDYGSIGTLLKRNWENLWRNYFLNEENFWEIEGNFILPEKVLICLLYTSPSPRD
jgi:glycyl-tRNA synthetase (class II)